MKLYQSVGPNPRVVLMFIEEKKLAVPRELVDLMGGENRQPDYLAKNPFGQLPLLETDDGQFVSDVSDVVDRHVREQAGMCQRPSV